MPLAISHYNKNQKICKGELKNFSPPKEPLTDRRQSGIIPLTGMKRSHVSPETEPPCMADGFCNFLQGHQLFLLPRKGTRRNVDKFRTGIAAWHGAGRPGQTAGTAVSGGYADRGYGFGAVCPESPLPHPDGDLRRPAAAGAHHHPHPGGAFAGCGHPQAGGPSGGADVLCARLF